MKQVWCSNRVSLLTNTAPTLPWAELHRGFCRRAARAAVQGPFQHRRAGPPRFGTRTIADSGARGPHPGTAGPEDGIAAVMGPCWDEVAEDRDPSRNKSTVDPRKLEICQTQLLFDMGARLGSLQKNNQPKGQATDFPATQFFAAAAILFARSRTRTGPHPPSTSLSDCGPGPRTSTNPTDCSQSQDPEPTHGDSIIISSNAASFGQAEDNWLIAHKNGVPVLGTQIGLGP